MAKANGNLFMEIEQSIPNDDYTAKTHLTNPPPLMSIYSILSKLLYSFAFKIILSNFPYQSFYIVLIKKH